MMNVTYTEPDDPVGESLWIEETIQLLGIVRDHIYARSLDQSGTTLPTPVFMTQMLEAARAHMLEAHKPYSDPGTMIRADMEAIWGALMSSLMDPTEDSIRSNDVIDVLQELIINGQQPNVSSRNRRITPERSDSQISGLGREEGQVWPEEARNRRYGRIFNSQTASHAEAQPTVSEQGLEEIPITRGDLDTYLRQLR
jgi:hypothetical protein